MVRLSRLTTRTGDGGETGLGDGRRVSKASLRVEAIGAVDEANCAVGVARAYADGAAAAALDRVRNDLFDVGADLCVPDADGGGRLRVAASQIERLEREIAVAVDRLVPLDSFALPGGTAAAAHLHVARAVARRAERAAVRLAAAEAVNPEVVRYLNRLSDLLFALARLANDEGRADVPWRPGGER